MAVTPPYDLEGAYNKEACECEDTPDLGHCRWLAVLFHGVFCVFADGGYHSRRAQRKLKTIANSGVGLCAKVDTLDQLRRRLRGY